MRGKLTLAVFFRASQTGEPGAPPYTLQIPEYEDLVKGSILALKGNGFVALSPVTQTARSRVLPTLTSVSERAGSAIGYFTPDAQSIDAALNLRKSLVSYEEWIIGSCTRLINPPPATGGLLRRATTCNLEYLLSQVDSLNCVSVFYETGEHDYFGRLFNGIDEYIERLVMRVRRDGLIATGW